ncbi:MrcB family domain-containing protein [Thioclava sp. GXIMD4215]|uniref:MrcB family domain-containing protein n=1 Tax=Thioclava sp. GXIMD4215 TaxID=3131928 RepID=UPI00324AB98E
MLAEQLSRVAQEYAYERGKPFTGSRFGDFVRHDIALEAKKLLTFWPFDLKVKASVGQGVWASVPWLAFFDPLVTETATKGIYVVYLINPDKQMITLSMNQGTTDVYREYGQSRGKLVLKRLARDMADRVPEFAKLFSEDPIELGSDAGLPAGYEAGHAFGRTYSAVSLTQEKLTEDLHLMLQAYETLVNRGGTTPSEVMQEEAQSTDIEETRRYILSRRIERSPNVRKAVLKAKPPACECCGIDPKRDYGFSGPPLETPLDVHHAAPLFGLAEGETRRYKIPEDFMVLCPTCHRMIHKTGSPSDLKGLKRRLRFKIARDVTYSIS